MKDVQDNGKLKSSLYGIKSSEKKSLFSKANSEDCDFCWIFLKFKKLSKFKGYANVIGLLFGCQNCFKVFFLRYKSLWEINCKIAILLEFFQTTKNCLSSSVCQCHKSVFLDVKMLKFFLKYKRLWEKISISPQLSLKTEILADFFKVQNLSKFNGYAYVISLILGCQNCLKVLFNV